VPYLNLKKHAGRADALLIAYAGLSLVPQQTQPIAAE
jgi:hypothetical protein